MTLDGPVDGLVEYLYDLLWQKRDDRASVQGDQVQYWFGFLLPDTVLFKQQQPACWYFSTVQANADPVHNNRIRRKKSQHLTEDDVMKGLLQRGVSQSGIVASSYSVEQGPHGVPKLRTRHLDRPALAAFLAERKDRADCVLQAFVNPKSGTDGAVHNSMIQSSWFQPGICLVEKRENRHDLRGKRRSIEARAQTFEGYDQSEEVPLASSLMHAAIKQACEAIVRHIGQVAGKQVQHIALAWKVDARDRLQLLYCSQLRMQDAPGKGLRSSLSFKSRRRSKAVRLSEGERSAGAGGPAGPVTQLSPRLQLRAPTAPLSPLRFEAHPLESSRDSVWAAQDTMRRQHEEEQASLATAEGSFTLLPRAGSPLARPGRDVPPVARLSVLQLHRRAAAAASDPGSVMGTQDLARKRLSFATGLVLGRRGTLARSSIASHDFLDSHRVLDTNRSGNLSFCVAEDAHPIPSSLSVEFKPAVKKDAFPFNPEAKKEEVAQAVQRLMDLVIGAPAAEPSPPAGATEQRRRSRLVTVLSVQDSDGRSQRSGSSTSPAASQSGPFPACSSIYKSTEREFRNGFEHRQPPQPAEDGQGLAAVRQFLVPGRVATLLLPLCPLLPPVAQDPVPPPPPPVP